MLIASVDIDRVVREMDFQTLQQNIFNVAFCNIDGEVSRTLSTNDIIHLYHIIQEFRSLDPNFIKLFKLGQLIIEYLMVGSVFILAVILSCVVQHSQQYLQEQMSSLEQQIQQITEV